MFSTTAISPQLSSKYIQQETTPYKINSWRSKLSCNTGLTALGEQNSTLKPTRLSEPRPDRKSPTFASVQSPAVVRNGAAGFRGASDRLPWRRGAAHAYSPHSAISADSVPQDGHSVPCPPSVLISINKCVRLFKF